MEAARGQKHLSEAQKGMKELVFLKKIMKIVQQPQKPFIRKNCVIEKCAQVGLSK